MFVYTVYPIPNKSRKKPVRKVEPVSRIKSVHRLEYDSDPIPPQPPYEPVIKDIPENYFAQNDWKQSTGELFAQDVLPLLLSWRRPKDVVLPDYIQKYLEQLMAIQSQYS